AAAEAIEDIGRTQHVGTGEPPLPPVSPPEPAGPGNSAANEPSHSGVPWRRIVTNTNLWILCLMYFCGAYGWYFNITYLPGYLQKTFGLHRGEKWSAEFWEFSFLAGAPLLFGSVACLFGGILTDFFIRHTGNRKWGRRFFGVF